MVQAHPGKSNPLAISKIVLGLVPARLAAIRAIELAVFGEANPVIRLAQGAILDARAAGFRLIANQALEFFVGHNQRLTFPIETSITPLSRQAPIKSNFACTDVGSHGFSARGHMNFRSGDGIFFDSNKTR
jgi:hypothetical protein